MRFPFRFQFSASAFAESAVKMQSWIREEEQLQRTALCSEMNATTAVKFTVHALDVRTR